MTCLGLNQLQFAAPGGHKQGRDHRQHRYRHAECEQCHGQSSPALAWATILHQRSPWRHLHRDSDLHAIGLRRPRRHAHRSTAMPAPQTGAQRRGRERHHRRSIRHRSASPASMRHRRHVMVTPNSITVSGIDTVAPVSDQPQRIPRSAARPLSSPAPAPSPMADDMRRHTSAATISTAYTTTPSDWWRLHQFTTTTANTPLYSAGGCQWLAPEAGGLAVAPAAGTQLWRHLHRQLYNAGTAIELIATPNAGSIRPGWTGCDAPAAFAALCASTPAAIDLANFVAVRRRFQAHR